MTSPTILEFISLLELYGEIEWYGASGGLSEETRVTTSPEVIWRFRRGGEVLMDGLTDVLARHDGIEWFLGKPGRNWVLLPNRVRQLAEDGVVPTESAALLHLAESEPGWVEESLRDFGRLLHELEERLME